MNPGARGDGQPSPSACIVVFTKPAVPGRVKTRLQKSDGRLPGLSPDQAARLHTAFLADVLEGLRGLHHERESGEVNVEIAWALDGAEESDAPSAIPEFEATWGDWRRPGFVEQCGIPSSQQGGVDLGERLWRALRSVGKRHEIVVAVGSDHPELRTADLRAALSACRGSDRRAVFVPADDGGFVLLALRAQNITQELFEGIEWSTANVMGQCRDRARAVGLEVVELDVAHDCDDPEALRSLAERLSGSNAHCRHTMVVLRELEAAGCLESVA